MKGEEKNGEGKSTPKCHGSDVTYVISVYNPSLKTSYIYVPNAADGRRLGNVRGHMDIHTRGVQDSRNLIATIPTLSFQLNEDVRSHNTVGIALCIRPTLITSNFGHFTEESLYSPVWLCWGDEEIQGGAPALRELTHS